MSLIDISPPEFDLVIALAYATPDNITGRPFYRADARPYLRPEAVDCLRAAMALARPLGYRLKILALTHQTQESAFWLDWRNLA